MTKCKHNFSVYRVIADYRAYSPNSPKYICVAESSRECKRRFEMTYSWLKVYSVELLPDKEIDKNMIFLL